MFPDLLRRRDFLRALASSVAVAAFPSFVRAINNPSEAFPFSEVLSSGINFVHTSGKSLQKYLPEWIGKISNRIANVGGVQRCLRRNAPIREQG